MKRLLLLTITAAALVAVACFQENRRTTGPDRGRLDAIARALDLEAEDPREAARVLAAAGPGSFLEHARFDLWFQCLKRFNSSAEEWQRFLGQGPPVELARGAKAHMVRAMIEEGASAAAFEQADLSNVDVETLELMLGAGDPELRSGAAVRLAVQAPHRLRRRAPELEAQARQSLSEMQLLERAARWRESQSPSRGASELRRQRWRGELERLRRLEIARCEIAAKRSSRALSLLPSGRRADGEESLLRATAYRSQGWGLFPTGSWKRSFGNCLEAALRARSLLEEQPSLRTEAERLVVECAGESGRLDQAFSVWPSLATAHPSDARLAWIGRRLGVAMAQHGDREGAVRDIARTLPGHWRCLAYWLAVTDDRPGQALARLADVQIGDLYAVWALADGLVKQPVDVALAPSIHADPPPASVSWLLDHGAVAEAGREWRRIRSARAMTPGEGLAAALFEQEQGRANNAIRVLRTTFPELGGPEMARLPDNVVRAYLPLEWVGPLVSAAREADVDPWLVAAVARQESTFIATARSPRGAIGVLQLIPQTARGHALALGLGARPDLRDPAVNLRLGARELAHVIAEFGAVEPALAAYNAGPSRARRWWKLWPDRRRFTEAVPIPETYSYIRRVVFLAEAYRQVYGDEWKELS